MPQTLHNHEPFPCLQRATWMVSARHRYSPYISQPAVSTGPSPLPRSTWRCMRCHQVIPPRSSCIGCQNCHDAMQHIGRVLVVVMQASRAHARSTVLAPSSPSSLHMPHTAPFPVNLPYPHCKHTRAGACAGCGRAAATALPG